MSSTILQTTFLLKPQSPPLTCHRRKLKISHRRPLFLASASENPNGFSWDRLPNSILRGSERFLGKFGEVVRKETGIDIENSKKRISTEFEGAASKFEAGFNRLRFELVPEFMNWNKWDNWKDVSSWKPERLVALVLYLIVIVMSSRGMYSAFQASRIAQEKRDLTDAYMEALIPNPTPSNIRRLKKGMWRKTMPKGLKMKKFVEGPNGTLIHDSSYIGEDAWDDDVEHSVETAKGIINSDESLSAEDKKTVQKEIGLSEMKEPLEAERWVATWMLLEITDQGVK